MKKYSTYKNSGVEWIGEIPEHWGVKKLKFVSDKIDEDAVNHDFLIAVENIESYTGNLVGLDKKLEFSGFVSGFKRGDTIFNKLRPYLSKVYYAENDGGLFGELLVIRPKNLLKPRYQYYILGSRDFIEIVNSATEGTKMPRANWETTIKLVQLPIPPLHEQQTIVTYLDEKTTLVDELIRKKQQKIQLLKEKRTALVNHVVTKGLDPEVEMKDTDSKGINEIPQHWVISRLKFISTVRSGFALNGSMKNQNTVTYPYLRVANVQDGYLNLSTITEVEIDPDSANRYLLKYGDLLMNEGGDYDKLGRGCVWKEEISSCLHQNHVFAVRMNPGINSEWINLVTLTSYARLYFQLNCKQSTNLASISQSSIKELPVLLPPTHEQEEIITYLDEQTQLIDTTIQQEEQKIELLKEYRQSLISNVVTGKLCVCYS